MQRIQGRKKSNKHQLDNLLIYSLTALTCCVFCCSPFWFPSLCSSIKVFLFVSLPRVGLVVLSPKVLFILGNLIVAILIGESKFFASDSSPASIMDYDGYISRSRGLQNSATLEDIIERKEEKCFEKNIKKTCEGGENIEKKRWVEEQVTELENEREDLYGEDDFAFPADELSKRADNFIARVNRRRRLEANFSSCSE